MKFRIKKYKQEVLTAVKSDWGVAFCPKCGGSLWQNKDETKYCFRCGQRVHIK